MAKCVRLSFALAAVAVSFILGCPTTDYAMKLGTRLWALYGTYVRMWLEQNAAFFVVLCFVCSAVVLAYGVILLPFVHEKRQYSISVDDVDAVPVHLLRKHLQVFRDRIDFDQLLPQLYQDSVLSYEEEIMKIQLEKSRAIQTMHLVHMIEKKGKTGLKMFVNSLKKEMQHIGHHELASDLVNDYAEIFHEQVEENVVKVENEVTTSDTVIDTTATKNKPRLHLDSVVELEYHFNNDDDPCHKALISLGLQLFPQQPINEALFIAVCMAGNFELPPYYELVSPVFYFWSKNPIQELIKLDMGHCVSAETRKQATCLSFVSADDVSGPPFRFSLLDGGEFNPSSSSGVICTQPQGLLAIVKKKLGRLTLRTDPLVKFRAQMYYTWDTPSGYEVTGHFVVAPATKAWDEVIKEHFKGAVVGDWKEVSFNKSVISLVLPDDGLFVKGWSITASGSQKTIDYDSFTKGTERLTIQECKLSMKWVGEEDQVPSDLHYNIRVTGSLQKKSESYIHLHARCSQGKEFIIC